MRLGLTGGIGSGKSSVAALLAARGAIVIDADVVAREVMGPGTAGADAVLNEFGSAIATNDGAVDRTALAQIVFNSDSDRQRLEEIIHPLVAAESRRREDDAAPGSVVVHDVPLIVEKNLAGRYDAVAVVYAPAETRVKRLVERGMSAEDARSRIAVQATDSQRRAVADYWIDNSGTRDDLEASLDKLWANITAVKQ